MYVRATQEIGPMTRGHGHDLDWTEAMTDSTPATAAHEWKPPYSAASDLCGAMVMRDGGGDECGLPRSHPVHQPDAHAGRVAAQIEAALRYCTGERQRNHLIAALRLLGVSNGT